jgi:outer membrane lipoprotein-sorting protein
VLRFLSLALAAALIAGPLWAAGANAVEVLRKAILARGEVTYSSVGTVTGMEGGGPKTSTQTVFRQKGGRERIRMQDADGRTVWLKVCDGKTVWEHHVVWKRVFQRQLPDPQRLRNRELFNLKVLSTNYNVQLVGTETIAGRKAYRVRISRPGTPAATIREVWIDQTNFVELKTQAFGWDSKPVHTVTLERVNFRPTFEPGTFDFQPPAGIEPHVMEPPKFVGTVHAAARQAGLQALLPPQVPSGFSLYSDSVTVRDLRGVTALWFQYTNGIRTFSVFQRKAKPDDKPPGAGRGGMRTVRAGGYHFTIVGPLSPQEFDTIQAGYEALNR